MAPAPGAWTADMSGEQLIDVRFQHPTAVRRIRIVSSEAERSRTQEVTIWASFLRGERHREVVRQQFNFSPRGATRQVEDYAVELNGVSSIQLRIVPSIDVRRRRHRSTNCRSRRQRHRTHQPEILAIDGNG